MCSLPRLLLSKLLGCMVLTQSPLITPRTQVGQDHTACNVKGENDWIFGVLFEVRCHCILVWIDVHKGRLACLRKVKQLQQLQPLQERTKQQVDDSRLLQHVVMPEEVHVPLAKWWATLCKDDRVIVCCPHRSHGLTGKPSNRQNKQLIEVVTLIQYE